MDTNFSININEILYGRKTQRIEVSVAIFPIYLLLKTCKIFQVALAFSTNPFAFRKHLFI